VSSLDVQQELVCSFKKYSRQFVFSDLDNEDCVIDGLDIMVEIDKSKFGKRKYSKGHVIE